MKINNHYYNNVQFNSVFLDQNYISGHYNT
jgi:hypothetical protein